MLLRSNSSSFFRVFLVLSISGFGLLSSAFGDAPYVTWSNIGMGYGYGTNTVAFRRSAVLTEGNYQFAAYYDTSGYATVARRTLGSDNWDVFHYSTFTAVNLADDHDVISFGIDGDGLMHMVWGLHNNTMQYSQTTASVLNNSPIAFNPQQNNMTGSGQENSATYPEFYKLPDGDLLFEIRLGASGGGDTVMNRYDTATDHWSRINYPNPIIDGVVGSYNVNAYANNLVLDHAGNIQMTWNWRETSDYNTNHDIMYAKSTDQGATWRKFDGTPYSLPITQGTAEIIKPLAQNSSLMNQCSMTVDSQDRPIVSMWWAPGYATGNNTRQYMLLYHDGTQWRTSQITNRPNESMQDDGDVREMGRPVVLVDQDDRTLVVIRYRDAGDTTPNLNHVKVAYSTDKQNWSFAELTTDNSGDYEPIADPVRWKRDGILALFYEPDLNSNSMVSVLEWDALHWLRANITVDWAGGNTAGATNWGVTANWTNAALPPDGKWTCVRFGNQSSGNSVVNMLTTGRTVGNLIFTASTGTTIQSTGTTAYSLTLDNSGADSTISLAGTHTIAAQVLLNNDLDISGTGTLNLSGGVSGSYGMNILSGNINAASIQLTHLYIGSGVKLAIMASASEPLGTDFSPVPEPNAWLLLAVGAWCAWGSGRWRKFR